MSQVQGYMYGNRFRQRIKQVLRVSGVRVKRVGGVRFTGQVELGLEGGEVRFRVQVVELCFEGSWSQVSRLVELGLEGRWSQVQRVFELDLDGSWSQVQTVGGVRFRGQVELGLEGSWSQVQRVGGYSLRGQEELGFEGIWTQVQRVGGVRFRGQVSIFVKLNSCYLNFITRFI